MFVYPFTSHLLVIVPIAALSLPGNENLRAMLPFEQMRLAVLLDHFSSILLVGLVILILVITAKDIVCGMRKPFLDSTQVRSFGSFVLKSTLIRCLR